MLSVIEQQQGNAPEHSSVLARTSERLETTRNPVSFDPLNQQQLMNNQQPGMSQPQPRQQTGVGDMQLWQQQIMFKQMQELQRQKQLQQLQQDGRHQNQLNQLSAFAKQAANSQLPAIVNGMPIDGSGNFSWQNELPGGDSTAPNSSQMFLVGNPNWAQRGGYSAVQGIPDGLLSNEQVQMFRSVGLVPQQVDQSIYGSHNANTRGAFNQYSHQGISQDYANTLSKGNVNHSEKPLMQLTNSLHGGQSALFSNQASMQDGASVNMLLREILTLHALMQFRGPQTFGLVKLLMSWLEKTLLMMAKKTLLTVGSLPANELEFIVVLEDISSNRSSERGGMANFPCGRNVLRQLINNQSIHRCVSVTHPLVYVGQGLRYRKLEVILTESIEKLGKTGELKCRPLQYLGLRPAPHTKFKIN